MSRDISVSQALVSAFIEHPQADFYWERVFPGVDRAELPRILDTCGWLTKDELMMRGEDGKALADCPGFWRNFDKINAHIRGNAEHFTFQDFSKSLDGHDNYHLVFLARKYDGFGKVFQPDVWAGHADDMESTFYLLFQAERKILHNRAGFIDLDLKRKVLASEGRQMPEDRLKLMGLRTDDFHSFFALRHGFNYGEWKDCLQRHGQPMTKDFYLLPDDAGDTVFCFAHAWQHYEDIVGELAKNGERFDVSDFTRKMGRVPNILERAYDRDSLHKVFTPAHWEGRTQDMLDLWEQVLPKWKMMKPQNSQAAFEAAFAEAENLTYGKLVDVAAVPAKVDLLSRLNFDKREQPVIALGLKAFWENAEAIGQALAVKGEKITLADLRTRSGALEEPALLKAAKLGHFDSLQALCKLSGEKLSVTDLLEEDIRGANTIDVLAERKELAKVFTPDLWVGRIDDMRELWRNVRQSDQGQVDFAKVEMAVKQATFRSLSNDNFQLPPRPRKTGP